MPRARPNVLLVTIDTFRADRLGAGIVPALDRLAASGVRFTAARSAVPLTLPSHTTIHTGVLPPVHGVRENGIDALSDSQKTIATTLKTAGYQTAAFVGAFVLDRRFGLAQGFDTYDDQIPRDPNASERLEAERPASAVVDRAIAWLDRSFPPAQPAQPVAPSPWFVWIHLYDPHAPYNPPPEFIRPRPEQPATSNEQRQTSNEQRATSNERRATSNERYDGELRYADSQISRVFDWLRRHQLLDQTLIVVAGDHGEGLGDHGEATHGMLLYDSTLRVPLVISAPGQKAAVRGDAVTLADIAPTIVHAAGAATDAETSGRDLLAARLQPDLYSETEYPRVAGWSPLQALTDGRWKTIRAGTATEVYDLEHDPGEQDDVLSTQGNVASAMSARIDVLHALTPASPREISADAAQRLRALGYVASSPSPRTGGSSIHPAGRIASWNQFEEALSAIAAHRAATVVPFLKSLAASNPDAPVFQTTYALAMRESGDVNGAVEAYRRAAKKWPTDALLLHDFSAAARDAAGRTAGAATQALRDEAARAEQAALVIAPKSALALNGLGLLAIDQNHPRDAVKSFEAATVADPSNASYWVNLGNARRAIRDAAGAEQAYRRALDDDPRTADAANGLGVLLVEAHRPGDAVVWFERAIAALPDAVEARLNLGIALQQSGQLSRAAEMYRQVLAAPPRYARERDAAAHLLAAMGNTR